MGYGDHSQKPKATVISLNVIPRPERAENLVPDPKKSSVLFNVTEEGNPGPERINYICGKCGALLIKGAAKGQFSRLVLHCNKCDSYNDLP